MGRLVGTDMETNFYTFFFPEIRLTLSTLIVSTYQYLKSGKYKKKTNVFADWWLMLIFKVSFVRHTTKKRIP